ERPCSRSWPACCSCPAPEAHAEPCARPAYGGRTRPWTRERAIPLRARCRTRSTWRGGGGGTRASPPRGARAGARGGGPGGGAAGGGGGGGGGQLAERRAGPHRPQGGRLRIGGAVRDGARAAVLPRFPGGDRLRGRAGGGGGDRLRVRAERPPRGRVQARALR